MAVKKTRQGLEVKFDFRFAGAPGFLRFVYAFRSCLLLGKLKTKFRTNLLFFSYMQNRNVIFYVLSLVSPFLEREIGGLIGVQMVTIVSLMLIYIYS